MSDSDKKRCPICKRKKNRAIQEQKVKGEPCIIRGCVFNNEIEEELLRKVEIKVIKKEKKKISVVKKEKKNIKINRK